MSLNVIEKKSFQFSIDIVHLYKKLCEERREYILFRQFLKSGTSIGANVKEALSGQSKRDFLSKMNIALKEANETEYWIELLISTGYINKENSILCKCKELCKILNSIVKTTKNNCES
ncbi:four helix bundle protein [Clostridium sp. WLY-B-L2]|uniref:Four helix bundle protein n=1 Tax=Clostridium aromativorans TaxID=2836848 RepID=A0ABS8N263_9CLOT|nr:MULTISPECIES: four helix bundle protein [Clostridium]KAA8678165.1 four helix bundle protein [Clostridium sp. HV4-5-A1G]MCC9293889.1 four helix bundle protein [Clostridium aromativorans]